jgi:pyruvate dehydrogenase E2 component (dihydrolipoamide acetyltransferase)
MAQFLMPTLGADMDEGTLLEWLVKPGDEVHKGQVIAVVDTEKAAIEVESFATGNIERLIVEPGETVPVGTVLATITTEVAPAEAIEKPAAKAKAKRGAPTKPMPAAKPKRRRTVKAATKPAAKAEPQPAVGRTATFPAHPETWSPLVRHLADELGIDLATVLGTGHAGAITRADVTGAAAAMHAGRPAPGLGREKPRPRPAAEQAAVRAAPGPAGTGGRPRVSPLARRVAADLGVDLSAVTGTGPDGAIRESDVRRAAEAGIQIGAEAAGRAAPTPSAAAVSTAQPAAASAAQRLLAMRQVTARLMARSKREIPHYYLRETVDMSRAMAWLHDRNRELDVSERLVPSALLLKAAAVAARQVPALNGFWIDDQFVPGEGIHLGCAISLRGGGLITPAIHDAADMTPFALMKSLRDLVTRARSGRLKGSELTDATITVTNLGDQGVELVFGVIYPPQVALIGFGKVAERPVAANGMVGVHPVVTATLAADHRATDGYTGARFLTALSEQLQRPEDM